MIDITNYIDFRTGEFDYARKSDIINECMTYYADCFTSLKNWFSADDVTLDIDVSDYCSCRYYGDPDILEYIQEAVLNGNCPSPQLISLLRALYEQVSIFLHLPRNEEEKADACLHIIEVIAEEIKKFKDDLCKDCCNEACNEAISEILYAIPVESRLLGLFSAERGNKPRITIYTSQIAKYSTSPEEFNAGLWMTLSHETFHALHYGFCLKNNGDPGHWFKEPRDNSDRPHKNYYRLGFDDNSIIHTMKKPADISIVKESLASYFEYFTAKYSFLASSLAARNLAAELKSEWYCYTPMEWPYSGARTFIPDEENIDYSRSTFRTVLELSSDDWTEARQYILDHYADTPYQADF